MIRTTCDLPTHYGHKTHTRLSRNAAVTLLTILLALGLATRVLALGKMPSCPTNLQSAGDGELVITITQVDSHAFPQVTAHVTVSDADGWPLGNLTAANFEVFEDDTQVPATSIAVEMIQDDLQELGLILALDVSTPDETLTKVQETMKSFIGTRGSLDQVAIITFDNDVQIAQDFTTNKEELRATIDTLKSGGNYTALNEAVFEAATVAGTLSTDRRMVIVLTDSKNNIGTLSATDAISRAIESEVPIYIIGFGSKVESEALADMARLTGGQARIFSSPDGVRTSLQALEGLPQPAYQVTFQSGLKADDAEHDLSIGVTYVDGEGQSKARSIFTAVHGEMTVTLPGIVDGQTVGGIVNLVADVTAPAPIVSMEYLLDGKLLAKQYAPTTVTSASYGFDWDSTTVEPGAYTLTVGAIDSAGNAGYTQTHLDVVLPVAVSVSTSRPEIELGNEVAIEAQVNALVDMVEVEFLLDGKSLGVINTPPYRFSFDSSAYSAGEHIVTVHAGDSLGREDSASISIQFLAPPESPPQREWLRYVKTAVVVVVVIVAAVVGIVIAVIAFSAASKWQRKKRRAICRLEIQNLGNVRSRYRLLAEDPAGALMFQFTLDGVNLRQQQTTQVAERAVEEPGQSRRELTTAKRAEQLAPSTQASSLTGLEKARQATGRAKGANQAIVSVLDTVGALLPRSVGAPLRSSASRLRQKQAAVSRLEYAPRQTASSLQQVRRQVSQVKPPASSDVARTRPPQTTGERQVTPIRQAQGKPITRTVVDAWDQTPFVEPGETMVIDLLVTRNPKDPSERSHQTQHYPITVTSRSVEQVDAPPVVEEASVQIVGASWFDRLLPYFVLVVVITIHVLLIEVLLRSTGILG